MKTDFHIDVVPGRYVEGTSGDVYLYQNGLDKSWLKTNLDIHISHVRTSGLLDAIRLAKLLREVTGGTVKTFVLELLVIKILADKKSSPLSDQLTHLCTTFRDDSESLSVEDPANPYGNDLSGALNNVVKGELAEMGRRTLQTVETSGWEAVFGPVETGHKEALSRIVTASRPARPWYGA